MSLFISSLNSGSNGNCYYIGNDQEAILVDAGISCREIEKRMYRLGLPVSRLKAIFISHEHTDHISGLAVTAAKFQLPVYITSATLRGAGIKIEQRLIVPFEAYRPVTVGGLTISAFPKAHDASDPHSFIISSANARVGVFTDIGNVCKELVSHFKQCDAAFLESNYDEAMLMQGKYPYFLKNRIRGGKGHLSNAQALQLFNEHRSSSLSHLLLSHLSQHNNCPDLVLRMFQPHAYSTNVTVAPRFEETPVYTIEARRSYSFVAPAAVIAKPRQMSLF